MGSIFCKRCYINHDTIYHTVKVLSQGEESKDKLTENTHFMLKTMAPLDVLDDWNLKTFQDSLKEYMEYRPKPPKNMTELSGVCAFAVLLRKKHSLSLTDLSDVIASELKLPWVVRC